MWRLAPDLPNTAPETYREVVGMYPTTDGCYETLPAVLGHEFVHCFGVRRG